MLRPGDLLVMYTDGVSEAPAPNGELFGAERIEVVLNRLAGRRPREVPDGLVRAVRETGRNVQVGTQQPSHLPSVEAKA